MIIKEYLSRPVTQYLTVTEEFLQLCGSWQDDRGEQVIAEQIRNNVKHFERIPGVCVENWS